MKSIYSESDLIGFIEAVLGCAMNDDDRARYATHLTRHDDPRRGYNIISTREELAYWLIECHGYSLTNFAGGIGLTERSCGGCHGYLSDELVADLTRCGELEANVRTAWGYQGGPRLTYEGLSTLRRIAAEKWL